MPKDAEEQELAMDQVMDPLTGEIYGDGMDEAGVETEAASPKEESPALMDIEIGGKIHKVTPEVHNAMKAARGAQGEHDRLANRYEALNRTVEDLQRKLAGAEVSRQTQDRADTHLVEAKTVEDAVKRAEKALETEGEFGDALRVNREFTIQQAESVMVERYFNRFLDILERHEKVINTIGETTAPIQQLTKIDAFLGKLGLDLDANAVYAGAREKAEAGMDWDTAVTAAALELDREGRKESGGGKPRQTTTVTEDEEPTPATRPTPGGTGRRPGTHSVLSGGGDNGGGFQTTNRNTLARQRLASGFK